MLRVLIIPVHAPAYVHDLVSSSSWKDLYPLLECDTFDTVILEQAGKDTIHLFVDDEGIGRGATPHLWARGVVIHGPAALVRHDTNGDSVDFGDESLKRYLDILNAGATLPWPMANLSRIHRGSEDEAYRVSERLRAEAIKALRARGEFVIEVNEEPRPKEKP